MNCSADYLMNEDDSMVSRCSGSEVLEGYRAAGVDDLDEKAGDEEEGWEGLGVEVNWDERNLYFKFGEASDYI